MSSSSLRMRDNGRSGSYSPLSVSSGEESCDVCFASKRHHSEERKKAAAAELKNPDVNLLEEFNQMTVEERNQVYEDIHGASKPIPETPQLLESSLKAMQVALDTQLVQLRKSKDEVDQGRVAAYQLALQKNRSYVEDHKFRLAFLRCELFDADKAARRYLNYFCAVRIMFGEHALGRDIVFEDLGQSEVKELKQGHNQFLPVRDSAGRMVQLLDPIPLIEMFSGSWEDEMIAVRACFYYTMRYILGSVETQRNGICTVFYGVDAKVADTAKDFIMPKARFVADIRWCWLSIPMLVKSVHFVYNDSRLRPFLFLFQYAMGRVIRPRFQTHHGSRLECNWALASYGIPVSSLPVDEDGYISYTKNAKGLARLRARDCQTNGVDWDSAELLPKRTDVLLGRGIPFQNHSGNVALKELVKQRFQEYDATNGRGAKAAIAMRIVEEIQDVHGGRFLKIDEKTGWWMPVSQKEAQLKVSQAFRKKREMENAHVARAKKAGGSANKRTKVQDTFQGEAHGMPPSNKKASEGSSSSTSTAPVGDSDSSDSDNAANVVRPDEVMITQTPIVDSSSPDELDVLMESPPSEMTPLTFHDLDGVPPDNDPIPLETVAQRDDKELFRGMDLSILDNELGPNDEAPSQNNQSADDPVLAFLRQHHECLKGSPEESFEWLKGQDIATLKDLHEACCDEEFVDLELKAKGGLKGFKRRPFIKAVASAVGAEIM